MAELIDLDEFRDNWETKNGYIASAEVLNRAVDGAQQEIIALWQFITDNVIQDGDKFINDNIGTIDNKHVRSIQGLHNEVFYGGTWS
jgi:protein involved in sex pheromone biosynthesis